jgi:hypothetical protein
MSRTLEAARPAHVRRRRRPRAATVAVGVVAIAGLVARLVVLHTTLGALDSDEAVVGLMAEAFRHGQLRAIFWGQSYGGTLEPALAAGVLSVVGASTTALKAVPIALSALAALLTWRVGLRVANGRTAVVAGLLVWVWPGAYVWWSTKERGFYWACLCLSIAVVLLALQIGQQPRASGRAELGRWGLLGLCAGLGFWESPQVLFVVVPVAIWLLAFHWRRCAGAIVAFPAAAVGALPWLVWNANHRWNGLHGEPVLVKGGYVSHLRVFGRAGLPTVLGLRVPYTQAWLAPRSHRELYAVALVVVAIGAVRLGRRGALVVLVLVAFPFVHAAFPVSGYVGEGRYLVFLLPWAALAVAAAAWRWEVSAALLACAVALSVAGLVKMRDATSPLVAGKPVPVSLAPLERALTAHGVTRAWADYWIAYRVDFETDGRVIVAPTTDSRYPPYVAAVEAAPAPADVFLRGTRTDTAFANGLAARGIAAARFTSGPWVVYVPARPVRPTAVPGAYP